MVGYLEIGRYIILSSPRLRLSRQYTPNILGKTPRSYKYTDREAVTIQKTSSICRIRCLEGTLGFKSPRCLAGVFLVPVRLKWKDEVWWRLQAQVAPQTWIWYKLESVGKDKNKHYVVLYRPLFLQEIRQKFLKTIHKKMTCFDTEPASKGGPR